MDELIRIAAFQWLEKQSADHGGILPRDLLAQGFDFHGHRITLLGPQGIWKPAVMELPLSITTIKNGPYDDFLSDEGILIYRYRGPDPYHRDNKGLREAMNKGIPIIYFWGIEKGKYLAEWPVYIEQDNPTALFFALSIDKHSVVGSYSDQPEEVQLALEDEAIYRRRYATTEAIARLHQGEFRVRVLTAYNEQCAFCRLRHQQLLDAAHIIPDNEGGEPIVPNGLSLCKIHHAAFDNNIVGLNADYRIIVRDDILEEIDGPMLKYGIQKMNEQKMLLPGRRENWPDRDRLFVRFERFQRAG